MELRSKCCGAEVKRLDKMFIGQLSGSVLPGIDYCQKCYQPTEVEAKEESKERER